MRNYHSFLLFLLGMCTPGAVVSQNNVIDLSGQWEFQIDREDVGEKQGLPSKQLTDYICLPGSMPQRLKGDIPTVETQWTGSIYDSSFFYNPHMERYRKAGQLKLPFFLTPERHYIGTAWYSRIITIPANWKGQRVVLTLERPHIETTVWLNGQKVGSDNSLCVQHEYDLTRFVKSGDNRLAIRIDNHIDKVCVGADSHSVTDQTQGNWNGITGHITLHTTPLLYADDVQVYPDIHTRTAKVIIALKHSANKGTHTADVRLEAISFNSEQKHVVTPVSSRVKLKNGTACAELLLDMGSEMQLWDEFHPALYRLKAIVSSQYGVDTIQHTFGMREFKIEGKHFYVNNRLTMLRGTVENCDFPLTGYAPTNVDDWERVFRICRRYGLNHMRFHSFCPPQAAFEAADLVGFYLQPEGPSWPNHGVKLGNGMPIDNYLMKETQRMNKAYGNHPSFCMMACGNEPAGNWVQWVSGFVDYWRNRDKRHVYTGASVGGGWAWQPKSMYHVKAGVRGLDEWRRSAPESTMDWRNKLDTVSVPFVSHETGQWCAFPNFDEISKYTGVNKARNFEIFRDLLVENNMGNMAHKFFMASGKLQALCYKHEIERTLRTPDYAGFQLLALNDYSGQGTALVGVTDVFFDAKEYCTHSDFREFCSPTVLLARIPKFTYWNDEPFTADLEIAHYGEEPITDGTISYTITDEYGKMYARGLVADHREIPLGNNISLGQVAHAQLATNKPVKLTFAVQLEGRYATSGHEIKATNHWDLWVYPKSALAAVKQEALPEDFLVCNTLTPEAISVLENGGRVLLEAAGHISYGQGIVQQFTPVFWNTSWFKMRPPHTTGLYIEHYHPIFKDFPTDYHSDMQWWELVNRKQVMLFSDFPAEFQPVVQSIDTWFLNRKIGMLFEAKVGKGRLVMTTIPIQPNEKYPVATQLRKSIIDYMLSADFNPVHTISMACISDLFTKTTPAVNMYTKDSPDELKPKLVQQ